MEPKGGKGMTMKPVTWVLDGEIMEDAGDFGGDIQVGPAISARFRSDEQPGARFEIVMYATAKEYSALDDDAPDCTHEEPEGWVCKNGWPELHKPSRNAGCTCYLPPEHITCSYKPGTVDVQAECTYRRNGRIENGAYESDDMDDIVYGWEGADVGYSTDKGMPEEIRLATEDAKAKVRNWVENINTYLFWDGVSRI